MSTLILFCLTMGVAAAIVLTIGLFLHSILNEISDDSARYSLYRCEKYQDQRLRIALTGLATIAVIVLLTVVLAWIL